MNLSSRTTTSQIGLYPYSITQPPLYFQDDVQRLLPTIYEDLHVHKEYLILVLSYADFYFQTITPPPLPHTHTHTLSVMHNFVLSVT